MESFNWNLLFGVIGVVFVVGFLYFSRPRPRCPECKSYKVGIVRKDPQGANTQVQSGAGGGLGGIHVTATVYSQVQYRCSDCEETWMATVAESK